MKLMKSNERGMGMLEIDEKLAFLWVEKFAEKCICTVFRKK